MQSRDSQRQDSVVKLMQNSMVFSIALESSSFLKPDLLIAETNLPVISIVGD